MGRVLLSARENGTGASAPAKFLIAQDLIRSCEPAEYAQVLAEVAQVSAAKLLGAANVALVKVENFLLKQVPELKAFDDR